MVEQAIDKIQYSEIVKQVTDFDKSSEYKNTLKIAFIRNITIDPMLPYLKYLCYNESIKPEIFPGNYDTVFNDVFESQSYIYKNNPDLIVLCLKIETLANKLASGFTQLKSSEIKEETKRVLDFIDSILTQLKENSKAKILVHNFETPVYSSFGILDYQNQKKQINTIRQLNQDLLTLIQKHENAYVVDVDLLQSQIGYNWFIDNRYWQIGKAPYTKTAYKTIAKEYLKFIRALNGKSKKCLVLDCDNTLWGGIVGEDGINHIQVGDSYPGSAYRDFQQSILNLYNRGILLAICSKNNEADVLEVFEKLEDSLLKKDHFVAMKINWVNKVSNIKEIASEIGIGLDSLVFVDDSEFEIQMVNKMLPEVQTILLPKDAAEYPNLLNASGFFDTLVFSEEDRNRTDMYKAEVKRKNSRESNQFSSLDNYYKYLEMEVSINFANEQSIPRISQLTQRTNQFNLTTKRYSESEIVQLANSPNSEVLFLSLNDQFGDYGIVGVAILKYKNTNVSIDSFLLSCRVIGRGVEDVLINACINSARNRNCENVIGIYSETAKNVQVKEFYTNHLFKQLAQKNGSVDYSFSLEENLSETPKYFKSITVNNKDILQSN